MWVTAEYEATALFTLKPATATASGGRTLPVPTPFAIKMALLDVVCRVEGAQVAEAEWGWLNPCRVALRPAPSVVVNNTFIKVLRQRRSPAAGSADAGFFQRTIAYREYAHLEGAFGVALEVATADQAERLSGWLACVNYLGKRGGFIQLQAAPQTQAALPSRFIVVSEALQTFALDSLLVQLDDTSPSLTFEKANVYSGKNIQLGKERILHHVALPYRLMQSSRGYTCYTLSSPDGQDEP